MENIPSFWAQDDLSADRSGVPREQIEDCQSRFGVRFPDSYVELFGLQNGGQVRDEELFLFALPTSDGADDSGNVTTVERLARDDEFVRELIEDELGDPQLVLLIAGDDGHTFHALDFNANGPEGEPRVVWLDFECSHCEEAGPSFQEFVSDLMRSDEECAVDMREIERRQVIAHEVIEYEYENGEREHVDQHLCDTGNSVVLFVDSDGPEGRELSRVEIIKPLDADCCIISQMRPQPHQTFSLILQPEDADAIQWASSRQTSDGRWKNGTSRGVPINAEFESTDKPGLKELRTQLLDGEVSERAAAEEVWQERMEEMSEEEMEAAFPHMMLQMMGEMETMIGDLDPDETPDELKPALQQMKQLKARMKADLEQCAAGSARPSAEILELMQQMMPSPEDFQDS